MLRNRSIALIHAAGLLISATALAQAPSFTRMPIDNGGMDSDSTSISSNGRYISGTTYRNGVASETVYCWDTVTGQIRELTTAVFFGVSPGTAIVLDDGRVFWDVRFSFDATAWRIHRWDPIGGQDIVLPGPAVIDNQESLQGVSRDGAYALGRSATEFEITGSAYILDFSFSPPLRMPLNAGEGNLFNQGAGITLPINGARFAYGTVAGNGTVSGVNWIVPNPTPATQPWEVIKISPKADYQIGKIGAAYYLYGDGPGRALTAPTSPFIFLEPLPAALSDDGSTVVGRSLHPFNYREAVVWRKGYQPALLKTILTNAGVTTPQWAASVLSDISADGSIAVGSFSESDGSRHAFRCVLPAANDNCSTARPVTYGTVISSTNGATRAGVSSTCASEGNAPDIWFSFVPLANETISIDTCGSTFDTTLSLYAGSCASPGTALACNDDATPSCGDNALASRVTASVFAGQTYFIRVAGYNGAFGSVRLTVTAPSRPVNDSCAQATEVPSGSGVVFDNRNALTDSRPPCGGTPFNDVWFKTVAPESGRMTFSTCGSTINTVMAVYDSAACADMSMPAMACGASNAACAGVGGGNGTRITVPCTAGQTLLVRVGGQFGASGLGQFNATFACDSEVLSPYAIAVRNSGALGYYRFEDSGALTAADSIRFDPYRCGDNPGTYIGNVNRTNNFQGKALNLDGTGGHVRIWGGYNVTDPGQCPALDGQATLEAWVKTTDPQAGDVLTNRSLPNEHSMTLVIGYNSVGLPNTEGRAMFISDGPGNFWGAMSTQRIDDGRWHHLVGRRLLTEDGLIMQLFVDGVQSLGWANGPGFLYSGQNGNYWLIGNGTAWPAANAAFNGAIDEVAIYCGALSNATIANHYDIGHPCPADVNFDHVVDFFDYLDFVQQFSMQAPEADFNFDEVVDFFDYLDYLQAFSSGC